MDKISLYLVATPIGNRGDLSPRAVEILSSVDFIAAEDTRTSGLLLSAFDIHKPMISYHLHNRRAHGEMILARLLQGEVCALVTDAGMPAVSDPGEDLVADCIANGLRVSAVPGPCAFVTALAMSGLPTRRFSFEGFLPVSQKERLLFLDSLREEMRTLIFYEAPHRLRETLADLCSAFGGTRRICCVREISKIYEEAILSTISEAIERYAEKEPRGEFVLIVEGYTADPPQEPKPEDILARWYELEALGVRTSAAAKTIAKEFSVPKQTVYDLIKDL